MNNDFDKNKECDSQNNMSSEFDTKSTQDFTNIPDEYSDAETAKEFGPANGTNDFFNAPGVFAPFGNPAYVSSDKDNKTDISELYGDEDKYDFESSTEFTDEGMGCGVDGDCVCPDKENCGHHCPDDESAATSDDYDCNCGCECSAREKCELDDYEIISDVLGNEKELVKLYSTALCESAEEPLRNIIRGNLLECADDQFRTFEFMQERGLYPTEQAPEDKIDQAKRQFPPLCDR